MILHEIFRVVSGFPRYISCYIAESRLLLGQYCTRDIWSTGSGSSIPSMRIFFFAPIHKKIPGRNSQKGGWEGGDFRGGGSFYKWITHTHKPFLNTHFALSQLTPIIHSLAYTFSTRALSLPPHNFRKFQTHLFTNSNHHNSLLPHALIPYSSLTHSLKLTEIYLNNYST